MLKPIRFIEHDEGWVEPILEEEGNPDRTRLTLEFKKQAKKTGEENKRRKQADKTEKNKEKIIRLLKGNTKMKTSEIAEEILLSSARVRALLAELVDEGIVMAEGKTNMRVYYIKK